MLSLQEIGLALFCVLVTGVIFHHYFILGNDPHEPPLVKGQLPLLGCAISLQRDMQSFLLQNQAEYGGIFTIYVAGQRIHVISDPVDGIPTYFRSRNFGFKEFEATIRRKAFLNTEEELRDDSLTNDLAGSYPGGLLSNEATTELVEKLLAHVQPLLDRLMDAMGDDWKEVDLVEWCGNMVFELSNVALMGSTFPKDSELFYDLLQFEENFVTTWKSPPFLVKKERALAQKLIDRMQNVYKNGIDPSRIIRERMQLAKHYGKEGYIPKDLLVFAWTNSMPTLFWVLAYIHLNSLENTFLHEIMKSINTSAKGSRINVSDIDFTKLVASELLNSALKETLRLQAHNLSPRQLEEDTIVKIQGKDYLLKKGTMSFAPSTLVNLNADIYEDPMTWKADRFLNEVQEGCSPENSKGVKYDKKKLKIPLLIFGAGTHACPGRRFAAIETSIMLCICLLYFELAPPESESSFPMPCDPVKDQYGMGVKSPAEPWKVRMRLRRNV